MTKKKEDLQDEFDRIQEQNTDFDISGYLATNDDLPGFGAIEVYDYNNDISDVKVEGDEYIKDLVDFYLGDSEAVVNHPYIKRKMQEDARIYADTLFLERMSKKVLLQQLKQVDNGDNSARMYEVINQTFREIRENNREGRSSRSEIEKLYKEVRKDMGLNDIADQNSSNIPADENLGKIIDTKDLNNQIDQYLKSKNA